MNGFETAVQQLGYDPETVTRISQIETDMVEFSGNPPVAVRDSTIDGKGLFSKNGFLPDERIAPMRIGLRRTPAGRFTNHSDAPNCTVTLCEKTQTMWLVAKGWVDLGEELTIDYREAYAAARAADQAIKSSLDELDLSNMEEVAGLMLSSPQVSVPVVHHFSPGIYGREVIIPAGVWALGHKHTEDCMNVVVAGRASVFDGGKFVELKAGSVFLSKANHQKFGFIHEELRHLTIHPNPTDTRDLDELEERTISQSDKYEDFNRVFGDAQKAMQAVFDHTQSTIEKIERGVEK